MSFVTYLSGARSAKIGIVISFYPIIEASQIIQAQLKRLFKSRIILFIWLEEYLFNEHDYSKTKKDIKVFSQQFVK